MAGEYKGTLKDKMESLWYKKNWVTGGTKIWPGIPSNWRIFESNKLDIGSQYFLWSFLRMDTLT